MTGSIWFDLSPSLKQRGRVSLRCGTVDLRGTFICASVAWYKSSAGLMNVRCFSSKLHITCQTFCWMLRQKARLLFCPGLRSALQALTQWLSVWLRDTWQLMDTLAVAAIKPVTFFLWPDKPIQPPDHPATTKRYLNKISYRISLLIFYIF